MVLPGKRGGGKFATRLAGRGFTLIELLIVVAIIAILSMIALPAYQNYMRKARRARAEGDLLQLAQLLERAYTVNRTYVGFTVPLAYTQSPSDTGATVAYNVALGNLAQNTYTITATPTGPQAIDPCLILSVDQAGRKTATGTNPSGSCW